MLSILLTNENIKGKAPEYVAGYGEPALNQSAFLSTQNLECLTLKRVQKAFTVSELLVIPNVLEALTNGKENKP